MPAIISDNARTILEKRYLSNGETVEQMFRRVAGDNEEYYNLMAELRFLPNSPTLFNAGLKNGCTLSACFVFDVDDSMLDGPRSIHNTRGKAVAVAKAGGGVGYYFGNIRQKGSLIKSVHRKACGPVAVLKDYHGVRSLVTQGGKRDLAQMGVLNCDHPDILDFIHSKDLDPQGLGSFNISVSWKDEYFSEAMKGGNKWADLFKDQCTSAWKTGCPGVLFWDAVNRANPNKHLGLINATNPCGETPNRSDEPCNLGSLSLPRYFLKSNRSVDWPVLERDAYLATCFLDDILDRNEFPHPDITEASLLTRKLGLGVMGWADLLALMHIHYDTEEAVNLGERIMECIWNASRTASYDMANVKGPYKGYSDKTEAPIARNETRTSVAPTGTIAIIADVFGSIEPHFALGWNRTTYEGISMREQISCCADLEGFVPKIASEISPEWHVRHQTAFQKYTDLGVSKTVNLPNSATVEDVINTYKLMWRLGCKGGTIFRDGCRDEQVLVSQKTASVYLMNQGIVNRKKLPEDIDVKRHKFRIDGMKGYLHVGLYEDGTPGEIFVTASMQGSTVDGLIDSWAKSFSMALQSGIPLEEMCNLHKGSRFEPHGLTKNPKLPVCSSIIDYIVRWLEQNFVKKSAEHKNNKVHSGSFCPECGAEAIYSAGCLTCPNKHCGWSRCG